MEEGQDLALALAVTRPVEVEVLQLIHQHVDQDHALAPALVPALVPVLVPVLVLAHVHAHDPHLNKNTTNVLEKKTYKSRIQ